MRVQAISGHKQSFGAKTDQGKFYNKTNAYKFLGLGLGAGFVGQKIISDGGFKNFMGNYHKQLAEAIEFENAGAIKEFKSPLLKRMANINMAGSIAVLFGISVGIGAIIDKIINTRRIAKANLGDDSK